MDDRVLVGMLAGVALALACALIIRAIRQLRRWRRRPVIAARLREGS